MSQLLNFQSLMASYLISAPGPEAPPPLRGMLAPDMGDADRRLAVYKNNVYARLVDALRDTFPVVERLVGEEFFRYAAVQFISHTPPKSPTLLGYGKDFSAFLKDFAPAAGVPYLSDVAKLEFLYLEAYHAPDAEPVTGATVATIDDGARLILHPSARLLTSAYQVSRIWELNRSTAPFENVTLPPQREYLLVIRPKRGVEVRRLSHGFFAALSALADGADLAGTRREVDWAEPTLDFQTCLAALANSAIFVGALKKDLPI